MKCVNCGKKINGSICEYCGTVNTIKKEPTDSIKKEYKQKEAKTYNLDKIEKIGSSIDEPIKENETENAKPFIDAVLDINSLGNNNENYSDPDIIISIFFGLICPPLGIYLLITKNKITQPKIVLSLIFCFYAIIYGIIKNFPN